MRILALLAALFALATAGRAAEAAGHPILALGSPAPDFSLPGIDGRTYSLKDFADARVLVLIFTAVHCPTAQAYEERIKKLVTDYAGRGVAIVAINPNHPAGVRLDELSYSDLDDTFESMKIRAADRHFNFPFLDDGPEVVARQYGPQATPHVFIFDAERKLRYQGRIDDSEREALVRNQDTRNAIDALLAGREPPVTHTPVFGCSTKWAEKGEANRKWLEQMHARPVAVTPADAAALAELRANQGTGKLRVINVWATWCGPCVAEFDQLIETSLIFTYRDFEMVTVAAEYPDQQPKVLKFLQQHHAATRNLIFGDTDQYKLIAALDPEWAGPLPHTLVVDPDGNVIYRHTGELDFLELRRAIVPALNKITPWGGLSPIK